MKGFIKSALFFIAMFLPAAIYPCTNLIVTKGASADGSAFLVYTNDGEWLYRLSNKPAEDHQPGDSLTFRSGRNQVEGKIHQVPHTYAVVGFQMNEYQLAVGETTFTGREELWNHSKYLQYWHLMSLALERAKTAREAVGVITSLVEQYGYGSEGESFSIVDPKEAWILEMVGTGDGGEGAVWVAVKIPDGTISAHSNMARIGEFPLDDPENCLYSDNVISFAVEKGYYDPKSGKPFLFNEAYNPSSPDRLKYCESRVWSLFRRAAPSLNLSSDYNRGVQGAERYPLWIEPDMKLTLQDVMDLVRDHYEGTDIDMTKGLDAGPFGTPNRWRPLYWEDENGDKYSWERPISTYNTCFSYIGQMRAWLPNEIGGICWFGVDDTYFTCYVPIFVGNSSVPEPFTLGDINHYSQESMWWVFNFVSNFANLRYSYMIQDIRKVQNQLETRIISSLDSITDVAMKLTKVERTEMLTAYSNQLGTEVHQRWIDLGEKLITKYNDGYVKGEDGKIEEPGYPDQWMDEMNHIYPEKFKIPDWNNTKKQDRLPY
ncbi:MAG: C69 family dipeptidase [Bacteroidales bacterium]|nr:C69 family dipeptidase [Bacteroidales bacterium]